ncbi:hypothetical protein ACFL2C_03630 [Patescibacteria group bacterium]
MERNIQKFHEREIVNRAVAVSQRSHLEQNGHSEGLIWSLAAQVSRMISAYNSAHPGEMLPKAPRTIVEQFSQGMSFMLVSYDVSSGVDDGPSVLYHGTMYPALDRNQHETIGMQVVEFGTAIAHPRYRGCGLGTRGAYLRMYAAEEMWGEDMVALSTNKQIVTARVLDKGGEMEPVSFWDHPYLSYLTCSCTDSSEAFGHPSCGYRRNPDESEAVQLSSILDRSRPVGSMPCTLIVSNPEKARRFENNCRDLDMQISGACLEDGHISVESMRKAKNFFDSMKGDRND